ncbi:MAG: tail fiber domain-containing protein, partial [Bacteroidia bacterium]|nr:tail fiber domain-containing protein [Bacteroidia bacterium]
TQYGAYIKYGGSDLLTIGTRNDDINYTALQITRASTNVIFNGNVGIGTINPSQKLEVNGNIQLSSNGFGIWLKDETTGTNWQIHSHGDVLRMWNGSVETVVGTQVSSRRWKDSIEPLEDMLEKINQLQGVTFTWKTGYGNGGNDLGFIAEDVGNVFPELVTYEKNGVDAVALNYPAMSAIAIEGIKELSKKNTLMENQIANQQQQIESQQQEIEQLKTMIYDMQDKIASLHSQ